MKGSQQYQNSESTFTEIFSILKQFSINSDKSITLNYRLEEVSLLRHHLVASIDTLLKGLQSIGFLLGAHLQNTSEVCAEINDIGYLISSIGNLVEALISLRADADHSLGYEYD